MDIQIKRVYAPAAPEDGIRILVDRLWPRGLTRQQLPHARWLKEIAPSPALRKWFGHDPANWTVFQQRYRQELAANPNVAILLDYARAGRLTLLYAARDSDCNHARVLQDYLLAQQSANDS